MPGAWLSTVLVAILPVAAGASILIIVCLVCNSMQRGSNERQTKRGIMSIWPSMNDKFEGSITKRIKGSLSNHNNNNNKNNNNYKGITLDSSIKQSSKIANIWRNNYPLRNFKWSDHPGLVSEAVEHGWSTFAFTFANMDALVPPKLWESCTSFSMHLVPGAGETLCQPKLAWEVNGTSSDYMQKIRINPSLINPSKRELHLDGLISTIQTLQTTLPLPGPPLGPLSFPQEGYYEITVFGFDDSFAELSHTSFNDNEHAQLIAPRAGAALSCGYAASDAAAPHGAAEPVISRRPSTSFGRISISIHDLNKGASMTENGGTQVAGNVHPTEDIADVPALQSAANEQHICAIGLAAECAPPFRFPGSDAASIGFFSNGRIFLNGKEWKKPEGWQRRVWGPTTGLPAPVTVGCGFDPGARRLFFTLNGEMVEEILLPALINSNAGGNVTCSDKYMEFTAYPLFPTIGANYNVTMTANFGQGDFVYAAANAHRVPDPCFGRPPAGAKAAGEDSADLFSMGHIDSQWLVGMGGAAISFPSPARVNAPFLGPLPPPRPPPSSSSSSSSDPVNPTSEGVDSDLFEITLDSRTL
eukprot:c13556_g1_i1 orf=24-1781(-)